jgi:hypothetical protein
LAYGTKQDKLLRDNPILQLLWEEYDLCRVKQFVIFKRPKKFSKTKEEFCVIEYPTGLGLLPHPGGVADQNYMKMRIFAAFLRGERMGCGRILANK